MHVRHAGGVEGSKRNARRLVVLHGSGLQVACICMLHVQKQQAGWLDEPVRFGLSACCRPESTCSQPYNI